MNAEVKLPLFESNRFSFAFSNFFSKLFFDVVSIVEHVVMCSILILNEILFFIIFYIRKNIIRRDSV